MKKKFKKLTRIYVLNMNLSINFNNDLNNLVCFDNICPHRGSKFVKNYSGKGPLVCPYHGFCYINGGLKTRKNTPLKKVKISLNKFSIEKIGKFIFFSINPYLKIKDQFDRRIINKIENISENISYAYDYNQKIYDCNYDIAIENAQKQFTLM